ncbi:ABC-F family ATP-binding cassette domain-containing protein [Paenibacillus hemerocallicola]|uniref:ABC-F family ATP-binding cassette domain-containing protein n=1 Tax=Paenibacillus hemerocallicola TaxID=1172614 RepID=A0A5C4SXM6_9BACL|nr:ABC-F family ATP-binding cassette domain-containing protein [Paenibacillus hemerocallicola]TNJ60327.1 ABC-F family ATP-binding cassette domain-containing protein [Paenibacillus hemerocallicola]
MNLLTAERLSKSFGMKKLFEQVSFSVNEGEKIGLIGINGTGKSTLLKVIAGAEQPDEGTISIRNGISVEYLPQNPPMDDDATVLGHIFSGRSPLMQLLRDYEQAIGQLERGEDSPALQKRLLELSGRMDAADAWQVENEAKRILAKLGIDDFEARMGTLSGGKRKRVALAGALIRPADIVILDEPTNHIDTDTVDWLEQHLSKSKSALLMITHDRYFLDRVAQRIVELDGGKLYGYTGSYSVYLEQKAERMAQQQASEDKRQNLFRRELAWIRRGAKARSTKQKARIERFEKLQDAAPDAAAQDMDIALSGARLGKKVIELHDVSKRYGEREIIRSFSYIVQRDDRIGIVGPNGAGKSTLLKLIAGSLTPDSGRLDIGSTVKIGMFSQENEELNESLRVIEYIREASEQVRTSDGELISASQMLERFLFPPSAQWTPIANLSGGEKRRLFLLRILMEGPNVLLLDEPTNDLDIQTLTVLEDYLDRFQGAVLVVSHDRYFLDRTVDSLLVAEGNGEISHHAGNFSEYRERLKETEAASLSVKEKKAAAPSADSASDNRSREKALKFSFKEQKEYGEIDDLIARAERDVQEIEEAIANAGTDYEALSKLTSRHQELEAALESLLERWTYLTELAERIERQKNG